MSSGKHRLHKNTARDLMTVVGVVLVTAVLLLMLPDLESDVPPALALGGVAVLAAGYFIFRRFKALMGRHRRRRRDASREAYKR
jgi:O-antigen/teichoic acid export membrane protein